MRELDVNALHNAQGNAHPKNEFSRVANVGIEFAIAIEEALGLEGVRVRIRALVVRHGPADSCK